jgi:hypothetical protein
MPLQNRVTPMGNIVAEPERGMFTGNRGIIHDPGTRTLLNRRWAGRAWLICTLQWRGVRRNVMGSRSWTELFFLDEATALAAGHRPCFLCRREAAGTFQASFPGRDPEAIPKASEIDRILHGERLEGHRKRVHDLKSSAAALPDGAMIFQDGAPYLILSGLARRWSPRGYEAPTTPSDKARLITPPSTVATLRVGYRPQLHVSASGGGNPNDPRQATGSY